MKFGIIEQLVHSTVRIETTLYQGNTGVGTGFFMNFLQTNNSFCPVIITNKHVIENSEIGTFNITFKTNDGFPDIGRYCPFSFTNFEKLFIKHPSADVDLAAFLINPLLIEIEKSGNQLFYTPLSMNLIPNDEERVNYSYMEEVVMIGYPSGIWDCTNNLPVIRKGITASHPNIPWNGKREFLTDIASFPGSSGSPIFLVNVGGYIDRFGNIYQGISRIHLLGIHYAGGLHDASGTSTNLPISTITKIPNNIGIAINSQEILELEKEVARTLNHS